MQKQWYPYCLRDCEDEHYEGIAGKVARVYRNLIEKVRNEWVVVCKLCCCGFLRLDIGVFVKSLPVEKMDSMDVKEHLEHAAHSEIGSSSGLSVQ